MFFGLIDLVYAVFLLLGGACYTRAEYMGSI